jgi:hypothetical protein
LGPQAVELAGPGFERIELMDAKVAEGRKHVQHNVSAPGVGIIDFSSLPEGTRTSTIPFKAADGIPSRGVLYTRDGEKTVVCFSHPRADMSQHYVIPHLLEAGYAAYAHQCRGLNNDVDCEHEKIVQDLAAGFKYLKQEMGFEKLILMGNSGGGGLFTFYQEQANTPPPGRLKDTAAGEPLDLNGIDMPKADGLILMAVHPGEGVLMLRAIDPSVVDEGDPLSIDPSLDMYNPANGYREPPESSSYSKEFLERYRHAQAARIARLDARARGWIADSARYKAKMDVPSFQDLSLEDRHYIRRRALVGRYMIIYRTEANPAYCDLSLHSWESTRDIGSVSTTDPLRTNYGAGGFARYITPRAWLSSWSISSRANVLRNIRSIHEPLLMLSFRGDNVCFPDDNKEQFEACPAKDKTMDFIDGDHFGLPLIEREKGMKIIVEWLKERFPRAD